MDRGNANRRIVSAQRQLFRSRLRINDSAVPLSMTLTVQNAAVNLFQNTPSPISNGVDEPSISQPV